MSTDRMLLRVVITFVAVYAVLYVAMHALVAAGILSPLLTSTASLLGTCSNATGAPATVVGTDLFMATRILRIDIGCTALPLMIVYSALVLAYPLPWKWRLLGLVAGLPLIALANMLRLLLVAQLAGLPDSSFLFMHDYLFQIGMVAVVIGLWAGYLALARRYAAKA